MVVFVRICYIALETDSDGNPPDIQIIAKGGQLAKRAEPKNHECGDADRLEDLWDLSLRLPALIRYGRELLPFHTRLHTILFRKPALAHDGPSV